MSERIAIDVTKRAFLRLAEIQSAQVYLMLEKMLFAVDRVHESTRKRWPNIFDSCGSCLYIE